MIQKSILNCKLEKTNESITPRSGLVLADEIMQAFRVPELVDLFMPKSNSNRGFHPWNYMRALLLMLYNGGDCIADVRDIRDDKALLESLGIDHVPSDSAIGDWLIRAACNGGVKGMKIINERIIKTILKRAGIKKVNLVGDPTIIKAEKREAKMTYEGYKGYRPVGTFVNGLNLIVGYEFREGNDNGRYCEFLQENIAAVKKYLKLKWFLGDSEYYQAAIINLLEKESMSFAIAANKDSAVMASINAITETDWVQHKTEDDIATNREIAETVHCMNNSNKSFRLVVLRWKKSACYCYHAIATNAPMSVPPSAVVWRYNKRATQENTIKELKNGFHLRKVPSGNFNANELFFALGVLIHNIFIAQKMFIFPQELVTATIEKIRRIFVVVAGKVIRKSGTTVLQLATTRNKFLEFVAMREMLYDIRNA